jgi:peptide chain release factor subunit 3
MLNLEGLRISPKPVINVVFVGHVDAGKSTVCGQILAKMGLVDARTLERYRQMAKEQSRESWYLSWCLDTNPEEREKGKTSEMGTASFELEHRRINILDAPGHKQYVFEMISGANRADVGILVISARINEFEAGFEKGGQTREHIILMRAGSIKKLVVLVNKMDDPSVSWSESRFDEIRSKIGEFLRKIFPEHLFIPVSGLTGDYIKEKGSCGWYKGDTLLECLDKMAVPRCKDSCLTITITEKLRMMGSLVLYGKVDAGRASMNMPVKILPQNVTNSIMCIYNDEDVELEEAAAGDVIKLKFVEDVEDVMVGSKVVELENEDYRIAREFTCGLTILEPDVIVSPGYQCMLHLGVMTLPCKVKEVRDLENNRMRFAKAGSKVLAKIVVGTSICLCCANGDERKERFALRCESKTIALGVVRTVK